MSLTAVPVNQLSKKRERERKKILYPVPITTASQGANHIFGTKRNHRRYRWGHKDIPEHMWSTCINESSFSLIFKSHKVHINIGNYAVKPPSCQLHTGNIFKKKSTTHAYM